MVKFREIRDRRPKGRALEPYALPVLLGRSLSLYLTYALINMRVRPDEITFTSIALQVAGATAFVAGIPLLGASLFALSFLFDCSDGEVARVVGGTHHGAYVDSMGADSFYALSLSSIGYYLYSNGLSVGPVEPQHALMLGTGTSILILLSRIVEIRSASARRRPVEVPGPRVGSEEEAGADPARASWGQRALRLYRNWVFRQNLVAEPGIVLIVLVLVATGLERWISGYLVVLAAYHIPNVCITFLAVYWTYARRGAPPDRAGDDLTASAESP